MCSGRVGMNRELLNALLLSVVTMVSAGCIPLGPRRGQEQFIASRGDVEPGPGRKERIVAVPIEYHWMLLIAPDGPQANYVLSETWRYYLVNPDGSRFALPFLKHKGDNINPWGMLEPIPKTDLWIAGEYTGSSRREEHGHYDFRVICFNAKGIKTDKRLDFPDDGTFELEPDRHVLAYRTKDATWSYDPLDKHGPNRLP